MVQKEHVENFLRLNGVPRTASEDAIRSVLLSAGWLEDDVDMTLAILRGEEIQESAEMVAGRQLLYSDSRIAPKILSTLLGVQVNIREEDLPVVRDLEKGKPRQFLQVALLGICSVVAAAGIIFVAMYLLSVGA